ncbi:MAG: serine hydrolase [Bacilli bacterium]|nr:serine hydrolase [Bacilli bacterium]
MKWILKFIYYFYVGLTFLLSKKIFIILTIAMFISLIQVSSGYQEELIQKEQEMMFETKKSEIKYYNEEGQNTKYGETTAISELIDCYQEGIDTNSIPNNISKYIAELNQLYKQDNAHFSFLYQDLFSGFTVSYNEETPIFTASTIKAPAMIYLYEMASQDKIDLNERLTYTKEFYNGGSGILKNKEVNTTYTIDELIKYSIINSDNIAYSMLMNRFTREKTLTFWQGLGTKQIFTLNTIWGVTSAKDASIYMKELYKFSKENEEYGSKLMEYFKNTEWKLITNKNGEFNTANKGGWSDNAIHDVAIVFDNNPYTLVIMSNLGETEYNYLFQQTSNLIGNLHYEYWKYKTETCNNISQY